MPKPRKPCVACGAQVKISKTRVEVYEQPGDRADRSATVIAVCGKRRCQRLVREAIAESPYRKMPGKYPL